MRLVSVLTTATLVSTSGLVADASSAAGPQKVQAHLTYRCRFPSGVDQVSVAVTGTFPATMAAGRSPTISKPRRHVKPVP